MLLLPRKGGQAVLVKIKTRSSIADQIDYFTTWMTHQDQKLDSYYFQESASLHAAVAPPDLNNRIAGFFLVLSFFFSGTPYESGNSFFHRISVQSDDGPAIALWSEVAYFFRYHYTPFRCVGNSPVSG
jgi:hypothetical protein